MADTLETISQRCEVHHPQRQLAKREDDPSARRVVLLHQLEALLELLGLAQCTGLFLVVGGLHRGGGTRADALLKTLTAAEVVHRGMADLKLADKSTQDPEEEFELQEKLGEGFAC